MLTSASARTDVILAGQYECHYHSAMEDKILGTINTICLNFPSFSPSPPSKVVVCAPLYTLPRPKSVSSSQHCLEGGGEGQSQCPSG